MGPPSHPVQGPQTASTRVPPWGRREGGEGHSEQPQDRSHPPLTPFSKGLRAAPPPVHQQQCLPHEPTAPVAQTGKARCICPGRRGPLGDVLLVPGSHSGALATMHTRSGLDDRLSSEVGTEGFRERLEAIYRLWGRRAPAPAPAQRGAVVLLRRQRAVKARRGPKGSWAGGTKKTLRPQGNVGSSTRCLRAQVPSPPPSSWGYL